MERMNEDTGVTAPSTGRARRHNHNWDVAVSRLAAVLLPTVAALGLVAPAANAVPETNLDENLAALWTTILETPRAHNPFGPPGTPFTCIDLGGTVAPFGPNGVKKCTVDPDTKIYIAAASAECSTFETNFTTEDELRNCARQADAPAAPSVTVDGQSLPVNEVETPLLNIVLPKNNVFGLPAGTTGVSVGHGWAAPLLDPLTPGTHTIVLDNLGQDKPPITTTIVVKSSD